MKFEIYGSDFTDFVQESSYVMDQKSEYEEWEDGNYTSHRFHKRQKISGSFDMVFVREADLNAFINALKASTKQLQTKAYVYVQNINEEKEITAYIEIDSVKKMKISSDYFYYRIAVKVEEA